MATESIEQKADRYLTEGKVKVLLVKDGQGEFNVNGTKTYHVKAVPWTCDCPARVLECAHILACQKITNISSRTVDFVGEDDNTKFLADILGS